MLLLSVTKNQHWKQYFLSATNRILISGQKTLWFAMSFLSATKKTFLTMHILTLHIFTLPFWLYNLKVYICYLNFWLFLNCFAMCSWKNRWHWSTVDIDNYFQSNSVCFHFQIKIAMSDVGWQYFYYSQTSTVKTTKPLGYWHGTIVDHFVQPGISQHLSLGTTLRHF